MTGILIREIRGIFETHIRGQGHMEAKAETEVMQPQPKNVRSHQQQKEARRDSPSSAFARTLIYKYLQVRPPEL